MGKGLERVIEKVESRNKNLGGEKEKMKTRESSFGKAFLSKKRFALVEIAIVLCSVLLVATLPAAAITNYESGITNYEEAAQEDDYVLGVYGNANEDDTIDMRDLTYVKLIFLGKKPETVLADAKYDGKVNPLDFIQIKLIIVGKEKELTVIDGDKRIVTVNQPINRIVTYHHQYAEMLQVLDVQDKVVGVRDTFERQVRRFPVISTKPSIGSGGSPDIEAILSVEPDIVIAYTFWPSPELLDDKLPEHIAALRMDTGTSAGGEIVREEVIKSGYIFDARDEAEKYLEWHDRYVYEIIARVSEIPDDERVRVFVEGSDGGTRLSRTGIGVGHFMHWHCVMAGGINIAVGHLPEYSGIAGMEYGDIETEWVLDQNPEVILGRAAGLREYEQDDNTLIKAYYDEIMGLPGFEENVAAVKNDRVYIVGPYAQALTYPAALATIVKWFYPDRFEDIDPQAILQECMDLMGKSFNVYEQGAFVYPELS